ncbi:hypothetical protein MYC06_004688 [Vibrio parahaemolyticus]|nr:hypothetical protein [Vibrio parahaemolyticus]EJC7066854.1 hypothetical protein [Vibrio parahaemolyticus]
MSRFDEINRRCVGLAGDDATLITENGVRLDVSGVFDNAVYDLEDKPKSNGGNTGTKFQKPIPCFTVETRLVEGVNKQWRVLVSGREYFVAKPYDDGLGMTTLWLADAIESDYQDEGADGGKWR